MKNSRNKKKTNFRYAKRVLLVVITILLMFSSVISAGAAHNVEEKGYIEVTTSASINFNLPIDLVLVDNKTGYKYKFSLYRVNDYAGNFQLPLGTYTVASAEAVTDSKEEKAMYQVLSFENEVKIESTTIAVPINLMVHILSSVEISENDYNTSSQEDTAVDNENNIEGDVGSDSVKDSESTDDEVGNKKVKKDSSLLSSTLFFGSVLVVLGITYWVVKRRSI